MRSTIYTRIFIFILVIFTANSINASEKKIYVAAGTEGPLLIFQSFVTASVGYRISKSLEVSFSASSGGSSDKNTGPTRDAKGEIFGTSFTYLVNSYFFRFGPEIQNLELTRSEIGQRDKKWKSRNYGFAVGLGYQKISNNLLLEFIPVTYYQATSEKVSGVSQDDNEIKLRVLTWRLGYLF